MIIRFYFKYIKYNILIITIALFGHITLVQGQDNPIKIKKAQVGNTGKIKDQGKAKIPQISNSTQNDPNNGNSNGSSSGESNQVAGKKFFVAKGIDGEFETQKEACLAFAKVHFPTYQFVQCTTSFNGAVWYQFIKNNDKIEQQNNVYFSLRCPENALPYSTDGTDNWQKLECQCHTGYSSKEGVCIKDTIETCLGKLLKKHASHKEILIKLYKECNLWDSVCALLEKNKIEVEKFLTAAKKKTSAQDSLALLWKNIHQVDTGMLYAWQIVYNATKEKSTTGLISDYPLINAVKFIKYNGAFIDIGLEKGIEDLIKANKRANCLSCDIKGYPPLNSIDEFLYNANYFIINFQNQKVLNSAKQVNGNGKESNTLEGTAFQLRVLHNYQSTVSGDSILFEGSIDDTEDEASDEDRSLCKFDMRSGNWGYYHYYEFKSVKPKHTINATKQFFTYLQNIASSGQLTYIFDGRKISEPEAVKMLQNALKANLDDWYPKIPPTTWASLFACGSTKEEVQTAIENPNNYFYFRTVKVIP